MEVAGALRIKKPGFLKKPGFWVVHSIKPVAGFEPATN